MSKGQMGLGQVLVLIGFLIALLPIIFFLKTPKTYIIFPAILMMVGVVLVIKEDIKSK